MVNAWNGLRKVVVAEGVDEFKWDLNRYMDAMELRVPILLRKIAPGSLPTLSGLNHFYFI